MSSNVMKVFTGTANEPLAERIAEHLGVRLGDAVVDRFADGEIRVKIQEDVRGADVFVVQPTSPAGQRRISWSSLLLIDALRRASAERITAVDPLLRLRPPGPQGRGARADQREGWSRT